MTDGDLRMNSFQCPRCGCELEQTIANLKLSKSMHCAECGMGMNIDTDKLANAAEEISRALATASSSRVAAATTSSWAL
jgi:transcription elongation factor Elf1